MWCSCGLGLCGIANVLILYMILFSLGAIVSCNSDFGISYQDFVLESKVFS